MLLIIFVLSLSVFAQRAQQDSNSEVTLSSSLASTSIPDFRVAATLPSIVLADGVTLATSTIIVSPIDGFTGAVTLSDLPLPADLTCNAIDPTTITNGSGEARVACASGVARTSNVTITGTSGKMRHNAAATFTFATSTFPDFKMAAASSMSFALGATATSNITVTPQGGLNSEVNLTATGGASQHITTVKAHVIAVSPIAHLPSQTLGLVPATFFGIIAGIIGVFVAGAVIVLRLRGSRVRLA